MLCELNGYSVFDRILSNFDGGTEMTAIRLFSTGLCLSQPAWLLLQLFILMSFRSASGIGCENEGPCGADRYCSKSNTNRDICRHCDVIADHYCHDRDEMLAMFPTCDAYCFSMYTSCDSNNDDCQFVGFVLFCKHSFG